MTIEHTPLKDCFVVTPDIYKDQRGYFLESFNSLNFQKTTGLSVDFVQDNLSRSSKGVLRGIHFQDGEYEQAKLVWVISGSVMDVCVDLRKKSETFGRYFSIILDDVKHKQLFIPKGFAHGFITLEDNTAFAYKCDSYYHKPSEKGIIYNDKTININWNFPQDQIILSEKDAQLPTFENLFK